MANVVVILLYFTKKTAVAYETAHRKEFAFILVFLILAYLTAITNMATVVAGYT